MKTRERGIGISRIKITSVVDPGGKEDQLRRSCTRPGSLQASHDKRIAVNLGGEVKGMALVVVVVDVVEHPPGERMVMTIPGEIGPGIA